MTLAEMLLTAQARRWALSGYARQLRESAPLTQQEVADLCKVTQAAVAHWENGRRTPSGRPALRYAKLLAGLDAASQPVAS
ncbi:MAG TPA: helix-turn-helix transcriptional regulator [Acidimicrobiales bacterium]|nr:helix-turn-helix transcriptional regulator [Acidimicrobiales bacterium]